MRPGIVAGAGVIAWPRTNYADRFACVLRAELLGDGSEGAALSTSSFEYSSDEDLPVSSEGEHEKQAGQNRVAGGRTSLADLDYDALLAAGAQQRHTKQPATGTSDSEDEGKLLQQAAGGKRKRGGAGAAARAAVEDEHFNLG